MQHNARIVKQTAVSEFTFNALTARNLSIFAASISLLFHAYADGSPNRRWSVNTALPQADYQHYISRKLIKYSW